MSTGFDSSHEYFQLLEQLESDNNIPRHLINSLYYYFNLMQESDYQSEQQKRFSEPMPWIGMYIALASLLCGLAMVDDLLHGFRNKNFWFPCEYFTLNAASLSVIAVAMKLPMDLNNPMPGMVDHDAKVGSMALMCTMMANVLPSLATMNNKELVANIIALAVLVITLVVNICIQIKTSLLSYYESGYSLYSTHYDSRISIIYVAMLCFLLIIHISSALMILTSKGILEPKYQAGHKMALKDHELQQSNVEKLKQHVTKYWVMARTGSPQFLIACSAMSSASGVICVCSTFMHIFIMFASYRSFDFYGYVKNYLSDYKWSMLVILITQLIGVIVGTIAPLSRCFASVNFKLSKKWIKNHIKILKVESYWTQMLSDFKHSSIPFRFRSRKSKIVIQNLKILILSFCIGFQKAIVVTCKTIGLIPVFFVVVVFYCCHCWKWLKAMFMASDLVPVRMSEQIDISKDLSHFVLKLQYDMELAKETMKRISNSVDRLIQKAEKQQPNNLMKLLKGSSGFEGVEKFDSFHVPPLLSEEPSKCWSLPVVTLTSIAISLPNIQNDMIDSLLKSVSEGLLYVTLVEESLNTKYDHVCIQKMAKTLWLEVEVYHKWLGNNLQKIDPQVNTAGKVLKWFRDTAKNMVMEVKSIGIGFPNDENSIRKSISANSMYRITETILLSYQEKIHQVTEEQLVVQLSSMIADIFAACLTNIPRVIAMKFYASAMEKKEASVEAATYLLGETNQIINNLQDREIPGLDPEEMAYIETWRAYSHCMFP